MNFSTKTLTVTGFLLFAMLSSIVMAHVVSLPQASAPANEPTDPDSVLAFRDRVASWLTSYSRPDCYLRPSRLTSCDINDSTKTATVVLGGGFSEQFFTPEITDTLYSRVRSMMPRSVRGYDLTIVAEGHPIEFLIPNYYRKHNRDEARLPRYIHRDKPWTRNTSRPYTADGGLEGKHIALWASHGRYADHKKAEWAWQRPRLFCTTEDLLSQTIVIPYIIPMLQNAGAVVYTPRERDWQTHEAIVDNDLPNKGGTYTEMSRSLNLQAQWDITPRSGFAHVKDVYLACDTPFCDGTARYVPAVSNKDAEMLAEWRPDIPASGQYAVYVSYQSYANSVDDAHYTVHHTGGQTEFRVNQKIGGGTWVYLGTFPFAQGESEQGRVTLSNVCQSTGIVTADAVRFGGGMGNIVPAISPSDTTNVEIAGNIIVPTVSGMPRWAEAAKYSAVWGGIPYKSHTEPFGNNDYNNDINTRSAAVNYVMGQSPYNPNRDDGLRVPLDLTVAFHTDAGATTNDSYIGSLGIYRTDFNEGKTGAGLDRYVSRDLASILLANLTTDLSPYNWKVRQLRNANYGECREPMTPVCILEMLSHQNFADMRLAYNPRFKFDLARSVYKSIVKFMATQHGKPYVIQPLPVTNFRIQLNENKSEAILSWEPQNDPTEHTARPTAYIVYTRRGRQGFDNGTLVRGTSCAVRLTPDEVYSFKIAALNQGGESFPSETLSAGISSQNQGTVLIVNAFTRLEGPAEICTPRECGFDLDADPGVPYGLFNGFCGAQKNFSRTGTGREGENALGASGSELECQAMMGNTFDYPALHGHGILHLAHRSFTSCSEASITSKKVNLNNFAIVDMIYGVQKQFNATTTQMLTDYLDRGGKVLVSAASPNAPAIGGQATAIVADKSISTIQGCGLTFTIPRSINPDTYCVPAPTVLTPNAPAFPILTYSDGAIAAIALNNSFIRLGFPLEAITDHDKMSQLIAAFMRFL